MITKNNINKEHSITHHNIKSNQKSIILPFLVIKNCFSDGKYDFLLLGSPDSLSSKIENRTNESKTTSIFSFSQLTNKLIKILYQLIDIIININPPNSKPLLKNFKFSAKNLTFN